MAGPQEKKTETVSGKITPTERAALDAISAASPFKPSTSTLVALAVREFIERHGVKPTAKEKKAG